MGFFDGEHDIPPTPTGAHLPPWEDRERYGVATGFLETIRQVVSEPGRFYAGHPLRRGWPAPVLFAVLMGLVQHLSDWGWARAFGNEGRRFVEVMEAWTGQTPDPSLDPVLFERISLLLSPVSTLIGLVVLCALVHLGVRLLVEESSGFEATLRVVAYAHGAFVFAVVPGFGNAIGLLWCIVLMVIGVRRLHGTGLIPAVAAVVVPPMLAFGAAVGLLTFLVGLGFAL